MSGDAAARPLRVLMLNTERGWRGGENQVFLLATGLRAEVEAITACQPGSPLAQRLRASGREVVELPMRGSLPLGAARRLRALVRERGIDVVHAHTSHAHSLGLLVCRGGLAPLVVTRRVDFAVGGGLLAPLKYGRRVARFVAISAEIRRVLIAGGVDPAAITVIPSGVDARRIDDAAPVDPRPLLGAPAGAPVVGIAAALADHKDHRTLLRAWALVEARHAEAWLAILGDGELGDELRALAAELGLRRARFLGWRDDVAGILRGIDVFTLSSQQEGLGTAIMDAMFAGLPVVATRAGGIPELIGSGEDGLLVPVRDPPALAEALLRTLGDAELRRRLGAAARATADARFSFAAMVRGYETLYRELVGRR